MRHKTQQAYAQMLRKQGLASTLPYMFTALEKKYGDFIAVHRMFHTQPLFGDIMAHDPSTHFDSVNDKAVSSSVPLVTSFGAMNVAK